METIKKLNSAKLDDLSTMKEFFAIKISGAKFSFIEINSCSAII